MRLVVTKEEDESWRQCAARYGERFGLQLEVLEQYDREVAGGADEEIACFNACYDWDICDLEV